ncbi:MAG: major capsid protein [Candidatus Methanosuratincola sp.]
MPGLTWQYLTAVAKQAPAKPGWLTKNVAKNVFYSPLSKVRIVSESGTLNIATVDKLYGEPRAVSSTPNLSATEIAPPEIFEYDNITEELLFAQNYNPEVLVANDGGIVSSIDYLIAHKVNKLKERVLVRIEELVAQMIFTGQIQYTATGIGTVTISTGVTPSPLTLGNDVVTQMRNILRDMASNGFNADFIIVNPAAEMLLWEDDQFKAAVENYRLGVGQAQFDVAPYATQVAKIGELPPIVCYEMTFVGTGGTSVTVPDPNTPIMVFVATSGVTLNFGAIINAHLNSDMRPIQTDMAVWEAIPETGTGKYLYIMSRPLPFITHTSAVKIYTLS